MHIVIDAEAFPRQAGPEFGHIVDGFGEQPDHRGIQFLPFEIGNIDVADERFKKNIDKYGEGTAEFAATAIEAYCGKV